MARNLIFEWAHSKAPRNCVQALIEWWPVAEIGIAGCLALHHGVDLALMSDMALMGTGSFDTNPADMMMLQLPSE